MRTTIRRVWVVLVIGVLLSACTGSSSDTTTGTDPDGDTTTTVGSEPGETTTTTEQSGNPNTTDELVLATLDTEFDLTALDFNYGYPGLEFVSLQYDTLTYVDEDGAVTPWLATSWEANEDASEWTFQLREDVLWHDGEQFTAEDVAFTVTYLNEVVRQGVLYSAITGSEAEVVDDYTVIIRAPSSDPDLLGKLKKMFIVPEHVWQGVGEGLPVDEADVAIRELDDHTGTGPYKFVSFDGSTYVLEANEGYFNGTPTVGRILIPIISDVTAMFSSLQSGEISASSTAVPPETVNQLEGTDGVTLAFGELFGSMNVLMNNTKEPWSDVRVRNAVAKAIDIQDVINTVTLGSATPGSIGMLHPSQPEAVQGLTPEYDPEGAVALMDEAGYLDSDGDGVRELPDGTPISFEFYAWSEQPLMVRAGELVSEYLAEIGIEAVLTPTETNTALTYYWPEFDRASGGIGSFDMVMSGWSAAAIETPGKAMDEFFHSDPVRGRLNLEWYSNPDMDALLDELAATVDPDERVALMGEVQRKAFEDMPRVVLWYNNSAFGYRSDVYDNWVSLPGLGIVNKLSFISQ